MKHIYICGKYRYWTKTGLKIPLSQQVSTVSLNVKHSTHTSSGTFIYTYRK